MCLDLASFQSFIFVHATFLRIVTDVLLRLADRWHEEIKLLINLIVTGKSHVHFPPRKTGLKTCNVLGSCKPVWVKPEQHSFFCNGQPREWLFFRVAFSRSRHISDLNWCSSASLPGRDISVT